MSTEIPDGVPFTLSCRECDAGFHIRSHEQALQEGWTEIVFFPEGSAENYLGLCPDCRQEEERENAALRQRASRSDWPEGGE